MFEVDAWLWPLEVPADRLTALWDVLSPDETDRAARFIRTAHRDRYVVARAMLRQLLGAETGQDPRDIVFRYGAKGKPSIDGGPEFNLSHSRDLAALAVSRDGALGIDIERPRPIEPGVARRFFSPSEHAALTRLPGDAWLAGFYRCWTRKEAIIKAHGLGLSMPLDSFDVSLAPDEPAELTRIEGDVAAAWRLVSFEPANGWAGAIAARTGGDKIAVTWRDAGG